MIGYFLSNCGRGPVEPYNLGLSNCLTNSVIWWFFKAGVVRIAIWFYRLWNGLGSYRCRQHIAIRFRLLIKCGNSEPFFFPLPHHARLTLAIAINGSHKSLSLLFLNIIWHSLLTLVIFLVVANRKNDDRRYLLPCSFHNSVSSFVFAFRLFLQERLLVS